MPRARQVFARSAALRLLGATEGFIELLSRR
jgi:hypothetical protein